MNQSIIRVWQAVAGSRSIKILALLCAMSLLGSDRTLAVARLHADSERTPIFDREGVRPAAVRQGALGSCYFHSTIAAIAASDPELLKNAIETGAQDEIKVHFADGSTETVYMDDVEFARSSGFDLSQGLWVAILFRGYAQRTLRHALLIAVTAGDFPLLVKSAANTVLTNSDLPLLAYDRAVRLTIDQEGQIDHQRISARLDKEMEAFTLSADTRRMLLRLADSKGYFDSLATTIKANGELFGAYRAVGQGGIPENVLLAFTGKARGARVASAELEALLERARERHLPMTASSKRIAPPELQVLLQPLSPENNWFTEAHAYTVLGFDAIQKTITLRNPWGHHPAPDGSFTLPLDVFRSAFERLAYADNAP